MPKLISFKTHLLSTHLYQALRYVDPPDGLLTQLQVYLEEKQEDQDEMLDRNIRSRQMDSSDVSFALSEVGEAGDLLISAQENHSDLYPMLAEMIKYITQIFDRDIDHQLKVDVLFILERFLENSVDLPDFDDGWKSFMRKYLASIQHLVGKQAMIKANRLSDTSTVPSSFVEELEGLRSRVEELSDDKSKLRAELDERVAEFNTLRSLPAALRDHADSSNSSATASQASVSKGGGEKENFAGVIQRLIQKEKQVNQLQAEVERLSSVARPTDRGDAADGPHAKMERLERNRQWTNLMDEIARHKAQIADIEGQAESKDREIKYLKRALEAVYARFQSGVLGSASVPFSSSPGNISSTQDAAAEIEAEREKERERELAGDNLTHPDASLDAQMMAEKTIEALGEKDNQISHLRADVAKLQVEALRAMEAQNSTENAVNQAHQLALGNKETEVKKLRGEVSKLQALLLQLQTQPLPDSSSSNSSAQAHRAAPTPPGPPPTNGRSISNPSTDPSFSTPNSRKVMTEMDYKRSVAPPPPPPPSNRRKSSNSNPGAQRVTSGGSFGTASNPNSPIVSPQVTGNAQSLPSHNTSMNSSGTASSNLSEVPMTPAIVETKSPPSLAVINEADQQTLFAPPLPPPPPPSFESNAPERSFQQDGPVSHQSLKTRLHTFYVSDFLIFSFSLISSSHLRRLLPLQ